MKNKENILILHNIRSAHNVGAIFRTADAIAIDKIYLTGYTPKPTDVYGREQKEIAKTSLGANKTIDWESRKTVVPLIKKLQNEGAVVAAVEQSDSSIDYKKFKAGKKTVFILGNEVRGLSKNILNIADVILEIPMRGEKESLNVATTAGIVLFRALD